MGQPWTPSKAASIELSAHSEDVDVELIVVDNNSGDAIARDKVHEPVQGIARARNTGARHAGGDVLIFVDADVLMPPELLRVIRTALDDPDCICGGVDVDCRARRLLVRPYLLAWRLLGRLTGMVQGTTQFCLKSAFDQVGGYDETVWMGEDVDFYWTLRKLTKRTRSTIRFVRNPTVYPSTRRFDKWPLWKTLLWTNLSSFPCSAAGNPCGGVGTRTPFDRQAAIGLPLSSRTLWRNLVCCRRIGTIRHSRVYNGIHRPEMNGLAPVHLPPEYRVRQTSKREAQPCQTS